MCGFLVFASKSKEIINLDINKILNDFIMKHDKLIIIKLYYTRIGLNTYCNGNCIEIKTKTPGSSPGVFV